MIKLLKSEIYKLFFSDQMRIIFICVVVYVGILPFFIRSPGVYSITERYRNVTSDIAVMTILISLMSSVVFVSEYTQETFKNLVQGYNRISIFFVKFMTILLGISVLLVLWYTLGAVVVSIQTGSIPDFIVFQSYIKRFSVQILIVIMQASILLNVGILTKNQSLTNITSFILFFGLSFTTFFQWIQSCYSWGMWGTREVYLSLGMLTLIFLVLAYLLFSKQEIK